jgi:RTX calcium-binding nonapeptide repeat (4 copies)
MTSSTGRRALLVLLGCATLVGAALAGTAPATGSEQATGCIGSSRVGNVMAAENWRPLHPSKWQFPGDQVILAERGDNPGPPRRPFEYATLTSGPEFASVQIDAEVRIDEPVSRNDRDVIIIFGWQSDTQFNYAHLSQDNTIYPHNGIFVVNNADRLRIDDQWLNSNPNIGAEPSIRDTEWHRIRVTHCVETGKIEVFVDDLSKPRMTATDKTLTSGRVGFGSFDNFGRMRNFTITGTREQDVCGGRTPTKVGTEGSDILVGTQGDDVITGLGGGDIVLGQGGNDVICGGDGHDIVTGGPGDDVIYGGAGGDIAGGGSGNDTLYGGAGPDLLTGGSGQNTLDQEGPAR